MSRAVLADGSAAADGLFRLAAGREGWASAFDATSAGFLRSFIGPLLVLPLSLATEPALRAAIGAPPPDAASTWAAASGFLLYTVAYPALLALLVGMFGGKAGYAAFVVGFNWMRFWLNLSFAALGLAAGLGLPAAVVATVWIVLAGVSLFLTWRLARETLTGEIGFSLAVVMLAPAAQTASDALASALVRVFG